jgi:nitrous oxide reductase
MTDSDDSSGESRRNILRKGAAVGAAAALGIGGLVGMGSQNVAAATLSVDGATATSDAGRVSEIYVKDIDGTLKWDGANSSPGDTTVKLKADERLKST